MARDASRIGNGWSNARQKSLGPAHSMRSTRANHAISVQLSFSLVPASVSSLAVITRSAAIAQASASRAIRGSGSNGTESSIRRVCRRRV
jgi:hypothetical protein